MTQEPKHPRSMASKKLDKLEGEAMQDKWHFAEAALAPDVTLAVGMRFEYHLRLRLVDGTTEDISYISDSQALALLGARDRGHIEDSIRNLREARAKGEPAGLHTPRVSQEALDAVAAFEPGGRY